MNLLEKLFKGKNAMEKETWLVVGLGNYGGQYRHTRHNVGFDVTDLLCSRWNVTLDKRRCKGLLCEVNRGDGRVVICQPQTYMNSSGECVAELMSWYKCAPDHLLVIYDDIDLPGAKLRMRKNGSAGTHNGMRSILAQVGTQEFPRLRVGVGKCPPEWQLVDWVLSHYQGSDEEQAMQAAFARACDVVECWLDQGIEPAMQLGNRG